ncbi:MULTISPECIES: response regulator transcription factor [unclassified Sphingopyxis]|uniref:response regulator transcription factor n=1 Tax=unclassified Sphingopyxis TaxID=2614943 RepID=UPI002866168D|nr:MULTISPECIES: response regulator transcription factor [unclassified Sphingopyxis]MDR6834138.1 DNA-binding NarL/FixJ family response regulator [Sphingopyxis sp. BE122]MDR7226406.1 DNA-binding NarL/FixJ family response regulator [Sphingopyxis sp. BE259]
MTPSIIIADDHPVFRGGLAQLVGGAFPGMALREAGSVAEMLGVAERYMAPWLFTIDLLFPGMDPAETLPMMRRRFPRSSIAVVSMFDDDATIDRVMAYGADAYIAKSVRADRMVAGLRALQQGEFVVLKPDQPSMCAMPPAAAVSPTLTERQVEVLTMLAQKQSNKQIARRLDLSHFTVRNHVSHLLRTMGAATRGELAEKARHAGLIA